MIIVQAGAYLMQRTVHHLLSSGKSRVVVGLRNEKSSYLHVSIPYHNTCCRATENIERSRDRSPTVIARVIFVLPSSWSLVITGRTKLAGHTWGKYRILPCDACSYYNLLRDCEGPTVHGSEKLVHPGEMHGGCCERFFWQEETQQS